MGPSRTSLSVGQKRKIRFSTEIKDKCWQPSESLKLQGSITEQSELIVLAASLSLNASTTVSSTKGRMKIRARARGTLRIGGHPEMATVQKADEPLTENLTPIVAEKAGFTLPPTP